MLLLEVLVTEVAEQTADENDSVEADAEAGRFVVGRRGDGAGKGCLGLGITGLCVCNRSSSAIQGVTRKLLWNTTRNRG